MNSFKPPLAKVFALRQLHLIKSGMPEKAAFSQVEQELARELADLRRCDRVARIVRKLTLSTFTVLLHSVHFTGRSHMHQAKASQFLLPCALLQITSGAHIQPVGVQPGA